MRIGTDIKKKEKVKKVIEFAERIKMVQKEAGTVLRKMQKDMKWQADRGRMKVEE